MRISSCIYLAFALIPLIGCNQNKPDKHEDSIPDEDFTVGGLPANHFEVPWEEVEMVGVDTLGMEQDSEYVVFINPDSLVSFPKALPDSCPFTVLFQTSESVAVPKCDPQFDYKPLFTQAYNRAKATLQVWQCPSECAQERYDRPLPNYRVELKCIPQMNGTSKQYATVQLHMRCEILF
ncbi:MAG: hypothetical protein AAFQ98_12815 [Bacteroidota bacterium]